LARGQCSAALSGRVIGPPYLACQRPLSENRRMTWIIFATQRSPDFSRLRAVLEPQSCDDLAYRYVLNRRMPVGAPAFSGVGDRRSMMNPSPFPNRQTTSRDFNRIFVRDFGLIAGLRLSDRSAPLCSQGLLKMGKRGPERELGLPVRFGWSLGGHGVEPKDVTRGRVRTRGRHDRSWP